MHRLFFLMGWRFILGLWLVCFGVPIANAEPVEPKVSLKFCIFAWNADVEPLRFGPKNEIELVEVSTRSKIQDYTGPITLKFTAVGTVDSGAEPAKSKPPAATVQLPTGVSRLTLLTMRAGRGTYRMYPIVEDGDSFPEGTIRVHNVTAQKLLVAYNENKRVEIAPGTMAIVQPDGDAMLVRVAGMRNGRWHELFNNVATLNSNRRNNVLLVPAGGSGVSMYSLPEWIADPKTPSANGLQPTPTDG